MRNLTIMHRYPTSLNISWRHPDKEFGIMLNYTVCWCESNKFSGESVDNTPSCCTLAVVPSNNPNLTLNYRIKNLNPCINYHILVWGNTIKGKGSWDLIITNTDSLSMFEHF